MEGVVLATTASGSSDSVALVSTSLPHSTCYHKHRLLGPADLCVTCFCVQAALDKGLILDTETQRQLLLDETYAHMAPVADGLVWPPEPLRSVLIRASCFPKL